LSKSQVYYKQQAINDLNNYENQLADSIPTVWPGNIHLQSMSGNIRQIPFHSHFQRKTH